MRKNNIDIIFISSVCSKKTFDYIFNTSSKKSGNAIQKFHLLLLDGLGMQDRNVVRTLSSIPVSPDNHSRKIWFLKTENYNNVEFNYTPIINLPIIKNVLVFVYSFFYILFSKSLKKKSNRFIVCDVLKTSIGIGAFLGGKIRGIKVIGIVTDMPGLDVFDASIVRAASTAIIRFFLNRYDGYIFITKQMNEVINTYKRPHVVMEGSVDITMSSANCSLLAKAKERILFYAGGIYERYGIKNLIDAFVMLKDQDLRLDICGDGPMEDDMPKYMEYDKRIKYLGVVGNEVVVKTQLKATLLINPRPTIEEFTKYSFPSKNMEYMASGTPLVTTRLPGMPDEYLPFVYLFNDETTEGLYNTLHSLLRKPTEELHDFGVRAKEFVLREKNNFIQAKKITTFLSETLQ